MKVFSVEIEKTNTEIIPRVDKYYALIQIFTILTLIVIL